MPHPTPCVIEPVRGWRDLGLREIWSARGLLYYLTWRDVKVRYKQTMIGALWAILQPILTVTIFTLLFGRLVGIDSGKHPYAVFAFAGLVPWIFFAQSVTRSSASLVSAANLIKKVYFPRLAVPLAAVFAGMIDLFLAVLTFAVLLVTYRVPPSYALIAAPAMLLLVLIAALGVGIWLSAINSRYRDVGLVVPFLIQIWLFVTPVIYPSTLVTERLANVGVPTWLYALNPMVGVIEGFRWTFLGSPPSWSAILVSSSVSCLLLVTGVVFFRRVEATMADVV